MKRNGSMDLHVECLPSCYLESFLLLVLFFVVKNILLCYRASSPCVLSSYVHRTETVLVQSIAKYILTLRTYKRSTLIEKRLINSDFRGSNERETIQRVISGVNKTSWRSTAIFPFPPLSFTTKASPHYTFRLLTMSSPTKLKAHNPK